MKMAVTLEGVHTHTHTHTHTSILIKINKSYTFVKSAVSFVNRNIENEIQDSFKRCT